MERRSGFTYGSLYSSKWQREYLGTWVDYEPPESLKQAVAEAKARRDERINGRMVVTAVNPDTGTITCSGAAASIHVGQDKGKYFPVGTELNAGDRGRIVDAGDVTITGTGGPYVTTVETWQIPWTFEVPHGELYGDPLDELVDGSPRRYYLELYQKAQRDDRVHTLSKRELEIGREAWTIALRQKRVATEAKKKAREPSIVVDLWDYDD